MMHEEQGFFTDPVTRLPVRASADSQPFRIALYSHDTCGLGHMRRNLLIAEAIQRSFPGAHILMLTGAREAVAFRFPEGVDIVTLPALYKEENDRYRSRSRRFEVEDLISMRSRLIRVSLEAFEPDLLIVDKVARGTLGELEDALSYLRAFTQTRCVLGLRDILDRPDIVKIEWENARTTEAIERYYDAVWVYGDPNIYETARIYELPGEVVARLSYTGYLDPTLRLAGARTDHATATLLRQLGERFFMCAVGGGQDGLKLAASFAGAAFPDGVAGLIVTGPHMPEENISALRELANDRPHLHLIQFSAEPMLLYTAAERVVSMGGYNTTCELMALRKKSLIIPRVFPREEQWIRARRLQTLGILDTLHPEAVTPESITGWFHAPAEPPRGPDLIDIQGLNRIPELIERLMASSPPFETSRPFASTRYYHHAS